MDVASLHCAHCGYHFNLEYVPGVSFSALRLGVGRSFKCPKCRTRGLFDLSVSRRDPGAATYRDPVGRGAAALAGILATGLVVALLVSRGSLAGVPRPEAIVTVGMATVLALVAMAAFTLVRSRLVAVPSGAG